MRTKGIAVTLGNEACGPIVILALIDPTPSLGEPASSVSSPAVTIHFKDGGTLEIKGLTDQERADLVEAEVDPHDDIQDSARASEIDMGVPRIRHQGQPHADPRVKGKDWVNSVAQVEVTRSAGPHGLYLALVAAGWAPAVNHRRDIFGNLTPMQRVHDSAALVNVIQTVFRDEGRPFVSVADV